MPYDRILKVMQQPNDTPRKMWTDYVEEDWRRMERIGDEWLGTGASGQHTWRRPNHTEENCNSIS